MVRIASLSRVGRCSAGSGRRGETRVVPDRARSVGVRHVFAWRCPICYTADALAIPSRRSEPGDAREVRSTPTRRVCCYQRCAQHGWSLTALVCDHSLARRAVRRRGARGKTRLARGFSGSGRRAIRLRTRGHGRVYDRVQRDMSRCHTRHDTARKPRKRKPPPKGHARPRKDAAARDHRAPVF